MKRLPFAPLTEAVGTVMYLHSCPNFDGTVDKRWDVQSGHPCSVISELTGINRRTLVRWTKEGIPEDQADRIAVALGLHVSLIWSEWFGPYGVSV